MNVNENAGNPILGTQRDQIISKPTQNTPTYRKIEKSRKTECREGPGPKKRKNYYKTIACSLF